MNYHPDVIKFVKDIIDLRKEYENILRKVTVGILLSKMILYNFIQLSFMF